MRLSYSAFNVYETCPKRYKLEYVDRVPVTKDYRNSAQGILVQRVIELWVNDRKFLLGKDARAWLHDNLESEYYRMWPGGRGDVGWSEQKETEILEESHQLLDNFVDIVKTNKLITKQIQSEVKIGAYLGDGRKVFGRTDFIIIKDGTPIILDGKATKKKIATNDQLIFYAMVYIRANSIAPCVGFLYYKLKGTGELQYVPYTTEDVALLEARVTEAFLGIGQEKFQADPSSSNCFYCPCKGICQEYKDGVEGKMKSSIDPTGEVEDFLI